MANLITRSWANTTRRQHLIACAILILAVSSYHVRGIRPGQTFVQVDLANFILPWRNGSVVQLQNWLISDPLYQYYPFLVNAVETVRSTHQWPLWNPRILLGHPTAADPLFQTFYPVSLVLGLAFGAARGLAIGLWLHAILAAVLTYGFLRATQCAWRAAIFGALTYALSGYLVTWFETPFWISTLAWLPGILWAYELAIQRRSWRYIAFGGMALAFATLGGQISFVVTFCLFLVLYALGATWRKSRAKGRMSFGPLLAAAMMPGLGFIASAVQIIPFTEFLDSSRRVLEWGLVDPLPAQQLITLIVPHFYGQPTGGGAYWGASNYSESTIYAGLVALLLAGIAPLASPRMPVLYLSAVGALTVYFILGGPGVSILGPIPVIKYISLHRTVFLLPLIIALLAAKTLSEPTTPQWSVIAVGVALLSIVYLALVQLNSGHARDHWSQLQVEVLRAGILLGSAVVLLAVRYRYAALKPAAEWWLIVLAFADLYLFGSHFNPVGAVAQLMPATSGIEYLRTHAGFERVLAFQRNNDVLLGPNVLSIYGVSEAGGYSSLIVARFHQLVTSGDPKIDISWMNSNGNMVTFSYPSQRLLDLLQVKYLISSEPFHDPGIRAEQMIEGCDGDSGEINAAHPVTGAFTVRNTAINRLDLRFRPLKPPSQDSTMVIRLFRSANPTQPVLEARQKVSDLMEGKITLYFAPERDAPGQSYIWTVSADESQAPTGVALCVTGDGKPAVSVYGAEGAQVYQGEMYIFERFTPLARAYVVYAAEHVPHDERAITRLLDETFDIRNVAITADDIHLPDKAMIPASQAKITTHTDRRVTIAVTASQHGLLVLAEQYHAGWRAYVDGRPTPVVRTNHILRGVPLSPGKHEVVFEFSPSSLKVGAGLSLLGIVVLLIVMMLDSHLPRKA